MASWTLYPICSHTFTVNVSRAVMRASCLSSASGNLGKKKEFIIFFSDSLSNSSVLRWWLCPWRSCRGLETTATLNIYASKLREEKKRLLDPLSSAVCGSAT